MGPVIALCQERPRPCDNPGVGTADVIIVGGGVIGASTAFQLTALGVRRVVLLERQHLGAGASGKSGALVRMHYTNEPESRLAFESLKIFRDFSARVGGECGFEAVGFVQIMGPGYERAFAHNLEVQQRLGIDTRPLAREDLARLLPGCRVDDIGAAAWEPGSGFADPNATTFAFAEAARRGGAALQTGVEVQRILVEQGRVAGVETTQGRIAAPIVVLAAGAWANSLLTPLGLDFGLTPQRIQITIFRWPVGWSHRHPAVIDASRHAWFRPEGAACTLIGVELGVAHADPERYDESVDAEHVTRCRQALAARLPAFAEATMRGGWAGLIMMSPDGRPIIDQIPSVPGLWAMLGDSGTSFKTSPAIGRCLAEWIVDGKPRTADLTPFRSTRFAEGRPWSDEHHYGRERPLSVSR
jgi:sarcosine oxidase, subunit beta